MILFWAKRKICAGGRSPELSLVFIAACRKRRQTARLLLPLHTPAPVQRDPGGEKLKLADPQIDARFENGWIERHARSLRRRRHRVTLAGTSRTPERPWGEHRKRRARFRPADCRCQPPQGLAVPQNLFGHGMHRRVGISGGKLCDDYHTLSPLVVVAPTPVFGPLLRSLPGRLDQSFDKTLGRKLHIVS